MQDQLHNINWLIQEALQNSCDDDWWREQYPQLRMDEVPFAPVDAE